MGKHFHSRVEMKEIEKKMVHPLIDFFEEEKDLTKLCLLLEMVKASLDGFFYPEILKLFKEVNPAVCPDFAKESMH